MKRSWLYPAILTGMLLFSANVSAQVVVVANLGEKNTSMEKAEIRNLFMGGIGGQLDPVTLSPGIRERHMFNTLIVGLTESRIQSYWAQMRFSGRNHEPVEVESVEAMLRYLLENEGSVGYLPADFPVPRSLTVLYTTG